jgi:pSer/pThr/pTyr-binding forkhead associated (FHA) protein
MSVPKPRLVVKRGPNLDHIYLLQNETTIVGREPINDAMLPDPEVSRRHCRIVQKKGEYSIEDLASTNGTFVNGRRISEVTRLSSGDIIDFGETVRVVFEYLLPLNDDVNEVANDPRLQGFKEPAYAQAGSYKTIPPYSAHATAGAGQDYYAQLEPTVSDKPVVYAPKPVLRPWQSWIIGGTLAILVLSMGLCGGLLYYLDTNNPELLWGWLTG